MVEHDGQQPEVARAGVVTAASATSRARRSVEVIALWAVWIGLGFALKLDANAYLLLGVPLTFGFQLFVRRRSPLDLWLRDGARTVPLARWLALFALLAALPVRGVVMALAHQAWINALWEVCAFAGAGAASYALLNATRTTARWWALCLVVGGTLGSAQMVLSAWANARHGHPMHFDWLVAGKSLWSYFVVGFFLEEVSFRGLIDSHVHHPGEPQGLASALFVSALWGLWHLPVIPARPGLPIPAIAAALIFSHSLVGLPLSWAWRRSGNLAVTSFVHAFVDAIRNGLRLL